MMEVEEPRPKIDSDQPPLSLLQADKQFLKKIMGRSSSVGSNSALLADNFTVPAEVPFKWESRPGLPKQKSRRSLFRDRTKKVDYFTPPPTTAAVRSLPAPGGGESKARPSTRERVKHIWKKVVEQGQKKFTALKNGGGDQPQAAVAGARRRYHSSEVGVRRSDDRKVGISRGSVSGSSSANGCNLQLEKSSKIRRLTWGFIKWVF